MSKRDYYEVLGVDKGADEKTMKSAFRKKAMECHPDRHPDDAGAEARFKELNEAYGILSDGQKRAAYDRMGHRAFEQGGAGGAGGFQDFGDIFSQIFGSGAAGGGFADMFGGGGGGRRQQVQRGSDLRYEMEVSLEEAFAGKDIDITVPIADDCERCDGLGAEPGASVETCSTCGGAGRVRTQQGFFTMERPFLTPAFNAMARARHANKRNLMSLFRRALKMARVSASLVRVMRHRADADNGEIFIFSYP